MKTSKNQTSTFNHKFAGIGALIWVAGLISTTTAHAGCTIDFEDLAVGTAVTTQYRGVTFSVNYDLPGPQSCSGSPPLYMRIANPAYGTTSSGQKCLKIDTGCPDFSPDYLRMVFALPQRTVSFTVGDLNVSYAIRYYSTTSGTSGQIGPPLSLVGGVGVHTLVTVTSPSTNILRIEVQAQDSNFEAIDDLTFDSDLTPPIAELGAPLSGTCDCDNSVTVVGRACDPDGVYDHDVLQYQPVNGGPWVQAGNAFAPLCTSGVLYYWDTTGIADGWYYLRLTVYNKCGLSTEAITMVLLDRAASTPAIRSPVGGMILGGTLCIDGSASDPCFGHYAVERKPLVGGLFVPVDALQPTYGSPVIVDPLASWNTLNNSTPDGDYLLRVTTFDSCGHSAAQQVQVTLDNTAPVGVITEPIQCSRRNGIVAIAGTAADAHLAAWVLQFSSLSSHGWVTIASGNSPVINAKLANWDTTGLPACAYAVRLIVTDQSRVNLDCSGSAGANQTEYVTTLDIVSDPLAQDTDADGMPDVWEIAHGFNPNDPSDAAQDADNDGATNLAEYLAGTDPRNPASALRLTGITTEENDTHISWTTAGSHNYLLEARPNVGSGNFNPVSPLISVPPNGPATTSFVHTNGATLPAEFYRVRLVP